MAMWFDYAIFFTDFDEFRFAIQDVNGGSPFFGAGPQTAIIMFGLPSAMHTGPINASTLRGWFVPDYNVIATANIPNPNPSGVALLTTQESVTVPGQAASYGGPASSAIEARWIGNIVFVNTTNVTEIPQRRWAVGSELEPTGEGGATISAQTMCRDASRTIDGHGYPIRGATSSGLWDRNVNEYRALTPRTSWERFYVRIRTAGATNCGIWRSHGSSSVNAGGALKVNTDRTISAFNIDAVNSETLLGSTSALELNRWYMIDVLLRYSDGAIDGRLRVFLNHVLIIDAVVSSGQGLDQTQNHLSSSLGKWTAAADSIVEIDLDDWVCADIPNVGGVESLDSVDWLSGSHIRSSFITSIVLPFDFSPNSFGIFNQGHNPNQELGSSMTSTTSGGQARGQSASTDPIDSTGISVGSVSTIVADHSSNAGGTDGQLGYSIDAAPDVLAVIDQTSTPAFHSKSYQPIGLLLPENISVLQVIRTKSADANLDTIRMLSAVTEYIGSWGLEDLEDSSGLFDVPRGFLHNCRYPNTIWGWVGPLPNSPVFAVGGTYVGDGLTKIFTLPAPCHFLWIRPTSGGTAGVKFFGSGLGGNLGATERVVPNMPVKIFLDIDGITKVIVSGTSAEVNQSGVTYQYIAFCDPGMRFNICGAYNHPVGAASPYTNNLASSGFTPVAGFIQNQRLGTTSGTIGLSYKGLGHGADDGNELPGTSIAQWGSFNTGALVTRTGVHYANPGQMTYSLWRTSESLCSNVMVQILSYIGDGTGSRNIPLTPISNRFPLFALVMPHGAAAFYRDPSHTGLNSCNASTLVNSSTAITGGAIDQITVGSTLNALGTVYEVFVIPGDTLGWNNGTFFPSNCDGPFPFTIPPIPEIALMGNGGVVLGASIAITVLKDVSGLYTLVDGKTNDTIYNRISGASTEVRAIPNPSAKTGFISG